MARTRPLGSTSQVCVRSAPPACASPTVTMAAPASVVPVHSAATVLRAPCRHASPPPPRRRRPAPRAPPRERAPSRPRIRQRSSPGASPSNASRPASSFERPIMLRSDPAVASRSVRVALALTKLAGRVNADKNSVSRQGNSPSAQVAHRVRLDLDRPGQRPAQLGGPVLQVAAGRAPRSPARAPSRASSPPRPRTVRRWKVSRRSRGVEPSGSSTPPSRVRQPQQPAVDPPALEVLDQVGQDQRAAVAVQEHRLGHEPPRHQQLRDRPAPGGGESSSSTWSMRKPRAAASRPPRRRPGHRLGERLLPARRAPSSAAGSAPPAPPPARAPRSAAPGRGSSFTGECSQSRPSGSRTTVIRVGERQRAQPVAHPHHGAVDRSRCRARSASARRAARRARSHRPPPCHCIANCATVRSGATVQL